MGFNKLPCAVLLSLGLVLASLVAVGFERTEQRPLDFTSVTAQAATATALEDRPITQTKEAAWPGPAPNTVFTG